MEKQICHTNKINFYLYFQKGNIKYTWYNNLFRFDGNIKNKLDQLAGGYHNIYLGRLIFHHPAQQQIILTIVNDFSWYSVMHAKYSIYSNQTYISHWNSIYT
jgi:hypothetical protein